MTKGIGEPMPQTLRERLARLLRLEGKASRTAKLIAWTAGGQPVWTPRDLASLAREGFARNAVVYRAVRMIADVLHPRARAEGLGGATAPGNK